MLELIGFLIIGLLAGLAANALTGRRSNSMLLNVLLGIGGALVGGWLLSAIGFYSYNFLGNLITAIIGAVVLIWLAGLFTGSNRRIRF
ncbi:MAG TPA: GlsB/YeaQ/YmgE family stress response membrane protein [Chloroflexia bacterium]|nr:GlsB/YeaQ/YmgE family stress response membrane protein [Chloroflexia bacterium]